VLHWLKTRPLPLSHTIRSTPRSLRACERCRATPDQLEEASSCAGLARGIVPSSFHPSRLSPPSTRTQHLFAEDSRRILPYGGTGHLTMPMTRIATRPELSQHVHRGSRGLCFFFFASVRRVRRACVGEPPASGCRIPGKGAASSRRHPNTPSGQLRRKSVVDCDAASGAPSLCDRCLAGAQEKIPPSAVHRPLAACY